MIECENERKQLTVDNPIFHSPTLFSFCWGKSKQKPLNVSFSKKAF